jgi:hypothetical protein
MVAGYTHVRAQGENVYEQEREVVQRIRQRFPEDAKRTDEWHMARGWDERELDEAPHLWVEAFADRTTDAARATDWSLVKTHTQFMAAEYLNGSEPVKKLVDVAYAENLLWNLEDSAKLEAWPHVDNVVKELYERMWGTPGRPQR